MSDELQELLRKAAHKTGEEFNLTKGEIEDVYDLFLKVAEGEITWDWVESR